MPSLGASGRIKLIGNMIRFPASGTHMSTPGLAALTAPKAVACLDAANIFEPKKTKELKEGALENVVLSKQSLSIVTDWHPEKILANILHFLKIPTLPFNFSRIAPDKIDSLRFYVKSAVHAISTRMKNENLLYVLSYHANMVESAYRTIVSEKLDDLKEWHHGFEKDLKKVWKKKGDKWVLLC